MTVTIIGGGAAGLMAAAALAETRLKAQIYLIDRNDALGKKVVISGGGRCNVTTGLLNIKDVLTRYPRGNKFLVSAMHKFPPAAVYAWFETHGVPLKIEDDLRVFPQSNKGQDIVGVFEKLLATAGVHVLLKSSVTGVAKDAQGFKIFIKNHEALQTDKLILATGGQAYRQTGSTGDGYGFALSLGHTLTSLAPSLNAFFTQETWPKEISGLSFERAKIMAANKKQFSYTGPFLFTHKGISGPTVFALSSLVAFEIYSAAAPLKLAIDLFPDQSQAALINDVITACTGNAKKSFINILSNFIPKSLAEILCRELHLIPEKHAGEASKKDLLNAVSWLKSVPLHVIGRGTGEEFVTAGGISTKEIDPATMGSKIYPGLYLAGEILDVDGFTGGFNLQASWATGRLAGESVSKLLK